MIRLHRVDLLDENLKELSTLESRITGNGQDRKESARELYKGARQTNLFKKAIGTALKSMNGGSSRCFYCLVDRGNAVDHFQPIDSKPDKAFSWNNYLWSCTVCNSLEKNRDYPVDEKGDPLLLNPVTTDPYPYLPLNNEGKVLVFEEEAGEDEEARHERLVNEKTLATFGLNENQDLVIERSQAWALIEDQLLKYQSGDLAQRLKSQRILRDRPIVLSVLAFMVHTFLNKPNAVEILEQTLFDALSACPEIKDWVDPVKRAGTDELLVMRSLRGKRVEKIETIGDAICLTFEGGARVLTGAGQPSNVIGRKLLNVSNEKGQIVLQFRGTKLTAPPNEWVFEAADNRR